MMSFNICRCSRSVPCGVTVLPRYAAITNVALTVWGYGATTLRCYYFLRHCISRSFLVGVRGYDGTLFLHYLIDCKYFGINS